MTTRYAVAVVLALAGVVAYAGATFLGAADSLSADVGTVISNAACRGSGEGVRVAPDTGVAPGTGGITIMHVCPPSGGSVNEGLFAALRALIVGNVPAAILAVALVVYSQVRQKRWSGGWSHAFMAGFVFQVSSLALTALLFAVFEYDAFVPWHVDGAGLAVAGIFACSAAIGAAGLCCWRWLTLSVVNTPVGIGAVAHSR